MALRLALTYMSLINAPGRSPDGVPGGWLINSVQKSDVTVNLSICVLFACVRGCTTVSQSCWLAATNCWILVAIVRIYLSGYPLVSC